VSVRHPRWLRIHAVVRRIPRGRVVTYGQVAELAGMAGHARQVGYALHALSEEDEVPWQRVVNARGEVSSRSEPHAESIQRQLLEREGVRFDLRGRIDLERYAWRPRRRESPG
jgi:methylated-DNA-protein-cysteine methyltransferase-like protein